MITVMALRAAFVSQVMFLNGVHGFAVSYWPEIIYMYVCIHTYMYVYTHTHTYICIGGSLCQKDKTVQKPSSCD